MSIVKSSYITRKENRRSNFTRGSTNDQPFGQHFAWKETKLCCGSNFLGGSKVIITSKPQKLIHFRKNCRIYTSWWTNPSQIANSCFTLGTVAVMPFYTLMVVAPKAELTQKTMESSIPYVVLGVLYACLLYLSWSPDTLRLMFASKYWLPELPGIAKMFSNEITLASAWLHLLAIDLYAASKVNHKWKWWDEIKMAEKLKVLNLSNCDYLDHVPHLSNFSFLEKLDLHCCNSLSRLDRLEQLTCLTSLDLSMCPSLETLPDLSKMRKLRALNISYFDRLIVVQGLEKLESLVLLNVSCCMQLQKLPDLSKLQNLTSFKASLCYELKQTRGLDEFHSLEHFHMDDCSSLKIFPDVSSNKNLRTLKKSFSKVSEVQCLGELEALEKLEIWFTNCLDMLPDLSKLTRLRKLVIIRCDKLIEVQVRLESLEYLEITGGSSMKRAKFVNLKKLKFIKLYGCDELTEICGVEEMESLEELIINCNSIENLPDLSNLKILRSINVDWCGKLTDIRGLEQLTSLGRIYVGGCHSLAKNLATPPDTVISRDW